MNEQARITTAAARALTRAGILTLVGERETGRITEQLGGLPGLAVGRLVGLGLEAGLLAIAEASPELVSAIAALARDGAAFEMAVGLKPPAGLEALVHGEALDEAQWLVTVTSAPAAEVAGADAARLRAIVANSPDAIYIRDREGRFVLVNPTGLRELGLDAARVIGRLPEETMPPPVAAGIRESDEVVLATGETLSYERAMRNFAGHEAAYLVSKYPYRSASGRIIGLIGVLRDISELKALQSSLTEQNERLQEVDRQKTEFVSALSHELRAPLTFIKGYVEFLEDRIGGELTQAQDEYVASIQAGIERLERLVDDLLDFARMDAGAFKLARAPGDLRDAVRSTVELLQPAIEQAELEARLSLPETPLVACVDQQRIGQVVTNMLTNAIKFSPAHAMIEVRAWEADGTLHCEVRDQGPGIAPDDLPRLFQRFSQLPGGAQRGGLGLGLSISKTLVEAHGGAIGVRSRQGHGATFWFSLPAKDGDCG